VAPIATGCSFIWGAKKSLLGARDLFGSWHYGDMGKDYKQEFMAAYVMWISVLRNPFATPREMENSQLTEMEKIKKEYQMLCITLGEILLQQDGLQSKSQEIKKRIEELNKQALILQNKELQEKNKELAGKVPEVLASEPNVDE